MIRYAAPLLFVLTVTTSAQAEPPKVVTDVPPVHSIVSAIMDGVAAPDLLVQGAASAHHLQLKPSQMKALQDADLVVWIGPELSPWLEKPMDAVGKPDASMILSQIEGVLRKEGVAHVHGHDEDGEDHDNHEGHDDHQDEAHDDHGDHEEDHAETTFDPHLWLMPDNAILWVDHIANYLIDVDPENAQTYAKNALDYASGLALMSLSNVSEMKEMPRASYIVGHDALSYLEAFYDLRPIAHIVPADGSRPSVAHVKVLTGLVQEKDIACILQDAETPAKLVTQLTENSDAKVIEIDPLGLSYEPGPSLYFNLMTGLHTALIECFTGATPTLDHDDHSDH